MLANSTSEKSVRFCELVEHPGGHDGGEFPAYEQFTLGTGGVVYEYGLPESSNDSFCDEDPSDFNLCPTREAALERLRIEKSELLQALKSIELLEEALTAGAEYYTYCEEEDEEAYGDDEEDDEEDDDEE